MMVVLRWRMGMAARPHQLYHPGARPFRIRQGLHIESAVVLRVLRALLHVAVVEGESVCDRSSGRLRRRLLWRYKRGRGVDHRVRRLIVRLLRPRCAYSFSPSFRRSASSLDF